MEEKQIRDYLTAKRKLVLMGDIDGKKLAEFIKSLVELSISSSEPIELVIDSPGGKTKTALQMHDWIKSLSAPVNAVVMGYCCSAAILPLMACAKRKALRHSWFMLHHATGSPDERMMVIDEDFDGRMKFYTERAKEIDRQYDRVVMERTGLQKDVYQSIVDEGSRMERFLSPDDALRLGLIDEIVPFHPLF